MSGYTGAYGSDSAVVPRVDLTFLPLQDDAAILLNDCYKLLTSRQGYVWWSPDTETMDVGDLLLDSGTDEERAASEARIERVLIGDQRISQASATLSFDRAELRIEVLVIPVVGVSFGIALTVSGTTAEVKIERTS